MDLREYLSVRRAYNLARQEEPSEQRITFDEFAILCRLELLDKAVKTSEIAEYQGALRPTMTHRTNHLFDLGLINREAGTTDRRNVVCSISDEGRKYTERLSQLVCDQIPAGMALSRTTPIRIMHYADAMGSVFAKAGDLILLGLHVSDGGTACITDLVDMLGLLQPTVSMSVSSLVRMGLVTKALPAGDSRTLLLRLTEAGTEEAEGLVSRILQVIVHRKPRSKGSL